MATFITTVRFTQRGLEEIQETTKRAAAFKASAKKLGIKVQEIYWTLGDFDGLIIYQSPDDETATAAMLQLSALGFVHSTTCRAFNTEDIGKIVGKIGRR